MAKLSLTDIASGHQSITVYNNNNTLIETAIENTLSRDGTTPNTMGADIDMNSNRVTNLADGVNNQDAVTVAQLNGISVGAGLSDIVDDTTPQLGGTLDANGNIIDMGTYTITDAKVGQWDTAYSWGDHSLAGYLTSISEANVETALSAATAFTANNYVFNVDQALSAGLDNYVLTYDHGTGEIGLEAASGGGGLANVVEDTTPQLGGDLDINGFDLTATFAFDITLGAEGYVNLPGGGGIRYQDTGTQTMLNYVSGSAMTSVAGAGVTNWLFNNFDLYMNDNEITMPVLTDYGVTSNSLTVTANAVAVSLATGNAFEIDLEAATGAVTITLSNPPASGTLGECILKVQQDTTAARTITWAGGTFKWPGGSAPTMSAAADAIDIYTFKTWDGGTTWYGNYAQAYA